VNRKEITFVSFASRTSRSDTNFIRRSARDTLPGSDNLGEHRVSISVSWSGLYRYLHVYTMWINTDCLKYCVCSLYQLDFWGIGMNSMNSDLRTNWFQWVDPTFGWQWVNIGNLPALLLTVKGKVKITLEQATKARGGGEWRCSSTLSLTSALDGGEWSTPRPGRLTPGKDPVPITKEAGWAPGPFWTGAENLAPTRIRSPDRPACSKSLYQLSYPSPHKIANKVKYFFEFCDRYYLKYSIFYTSI